MCLKTRQEAISKIEEAERKRLTSNREQQDCYGKERKGRFSRHLFLVFLFSSLHSSFVNLHFSMVDLHRDDWLYIEFFFLFFELAKLTFKCRSKITFRRGKIASGILSLQLQDFDLLGKFFASTECLNLYPTVLNSSFIKSFNTDVKFINALG